MNEIIRGLWIGDRFDAESWVGESICVLRDDEIITPPDSCRKASVRFPLASARNNNTNVIISHRELDTVAGVIMRMLVSSGRVLVFCNSGSERSPLAVAWYLHLYQGYNLDDAYRLLISKRPIIQDRRHWVI